MSTPTSLQQGVYHPDQFEQNHERNSEPIALSRPFQSEQQSEAIASLMKIRHLLFQNTNR